MTSNLSDLIDRYDAELDMNCGDLPRPTSFSIKKINEHFGINLPAALIEFSRCSKSFGRRFASIGPNYYSPRHIIRVNSFWRRRRRTRRIPSNLIIILGDFMDNMYWCIDRECPAENGDGYAIQFWCPETIIYASEDMKPTVRYPDFVSFIEADIYWRKYHKTNRKQQNKWPNEWSSK